MILLRSLVFHLLFWLWSVACALAMIPLLLAPRTWIMRAIRIWGQGILVLLRYVTDVKFEVRGLEHLPPGPALIASKHQASIDVFALFAVLPDACFVMKQELLSVPLFGAYGVKGGMIVVDRDAHAAALRKLVADAKDRMQVDRQVVIFPEGTRRDPGAAPDYKPGIAALYRELNLPVTPMALNSGVHWPAHGLLRVPGTLVFEYLPAIPAGLKRGEFMRELEGRIEGATTALIASGT